MDDPGPSSAYYAQFPSTSSGPARPPSPRLQTSRPIPDSTYYTVLNLPRSASDSQIRERYRHLASTFHPDRQRSPSTLSAAHTQFTQIQRAYEVLIDPRQRIIYDHFGEEGLTTSWEVGVRNRSPEELRRHFANVAYENEVREAEELVKPKSGITVVLDARAMLMPRNMWRRPELLDHGLIPRLGRLAIGRVNMNHGFEIPLGKVDKGKSKTQLVVGGNMVAWGGKGGGNVTGTIRHQMSSWVYGEVGVSLLGPRVLTAKGTSTIDENTSLTVNVVQSTILAPPILGLSLNRRLYPFTIGYITYQTGPYTLGPWGKSPRLQFQPSSSLALGLTTTNPTNSGWTIETQAGIFASHLSADYSIRIFGVKIKLGSSWGTEGLNGFVDFDRRVTEFTRMGWLVQVELNGGVIGKLRFSRLGQRIVIPVVMAEDLNPYVIAGATVLPALSYALLNYFYLLPRRQRKLKERVQELREENRELIQRKREEALEASGVMERSTNLKTEEERTRHGLVIVFAHYGLAPAFTDRGFKEREDEEMVIDVTLPVQALVMDSKLYIPGGRAKFNLLGFYDPCIGESKKLRIRYLFREQLHEVTVEDTMALRAPLQIHQLPS